MPADTVSPLHLQGGFIQSGWVSQATYCGHSLVDQLLILVPLQRVFPSHAAPGAAPGAAPALIFNVGSTSICAEQHHVALTWSTGQAIWSLHVVFRRMVVKVCSLNAVQLASSPLQPMSRTLCAPG